MQRSRAPSQRPSDSGASRCTQRSSKATNRPSDRHSTIGSPKIVTAAGQRDFTFVFRQNEGKLIGTVKSPDGVAAISNGYINAKTITFTENATVQGRRAVFDYTGELVSDTEIRFKREAGAATPTVEFVATRVGKP